MQSNISKEFATIWQTIFPDVCLSCKGLLHLSEQHLCTDCKLDLPITDFHYNNENYLWQKFAANIPITFALSYLHFAKNSKVQKLLHYLKYYESPELGEMLGQWYGYTLQKYNFEQQIDLLLPVPLHPSKLKLRGYNQSDCFAKGLAHTSEIDWADDVLIRNKNTETQTKKNRIQRWQNVNNIFEVTKPEKIINKHIVIVDDVITTGATTEACLNTVLEAGAGRVSVVTLASVAS